MKEFLQKVSAEEELVTKIGAMGRQKLPYAVARVRPDCRRRV